MEKENTASKKKSMLAEVWKRFRKNKAAMIGLVILIIIVLCAIFADLIVPYEKGIVNAPKIRLQKPSAEHIFGTDGFGRDVFARIIHGSRISLLIGLGTTTISLVVGGLLGSACGYFGGKFDAVIMRIMDTVACIPAILMALAVVAAIGPSLFNLMVAISIAGVPPMVRLVRSSVLTVSSEDFIEAAKSYGTRSMRIILKYILPNALGPIIVNATMTTAAMILSASGLSFVGLGIQPPAPEWGSMLSEAKEFMTRAPYLLYFPGASIILTALSLNLVGDGLRDALDPKLRN